MGVFRTWLEDVVTRSFAGPVMRDFSIKNMVPVHLGPKDMWGDPLVISSPNRHCNNCNHSWEWDPHLGKQKMCPKCGSFNIQKADNGTV